MAFLGVVLRPSARQGLSPGESFQFLDRIQMRFKTVRWLSLAVLLITGFFNLLRESGSGRLESSWGGILLIKLFLVAVAVGLTALQDFMLVPNIRPETPQSQVRLARWLSDGILIWSLLIVFVGVYLSRY